MKRSAAVSFHFLLPVVLLITAAPKAPAQNCWTPVVGWTGSYTLTGKGTGLFGQQVTVSVNEHYQGQVQLNLAGSACSSLSYLGSLPTSSVSINDEASTPCPGSGVSLTQTWIASGPGQNASATLDIDLSNKTYAFAGKTPLVGTTTVDACDGSTMTQPSSFFGSPAPPGWPPSFALPANPQELKVQNFQFTAVSATGLIAVPWTLTFTLDPIYNTDDGCNTEGGSNISCQNQSLGEDVPIAGTGFRLHYESARAPGAGGSSVASTDAFAIAGWTLSVHHVYDRSSNTLFLGDGSQRNGYRLGTPLSSNGKNFLTSEDGSEVYVFDGSTGRHLQTLKSLTGALKYQFGYDAAGNLVTVTDGSGNVTIIQRSPSKRATGIVSPYGQTTKLSVDSNGFLSGITDPLGKSVTFTNSSKGLLTALIDANRNAYNYTYDDQGRLAKDVDPAGGFTTLSRTNGPSTWTVALVTAMGRTSSFQTTLNLPWVQSSTSTFSEEQTNTEPCGAKATHLETQTINQLSESESLPDGTSYNTTFGPDPRWGIQVPVPTSTTLTLGNLTAKTSHKRTASLGTTGNPFSLTTQTDTDTVNGRIYTSTFTASNRTYTNTTPVGRQQLVTLDTKERIATTQFGLLLATQFAYDSRGRLASATQGPRNTSLTYDADGRVASITDPLKLKRSFTYDPDGRLLTMTLSDGRIINHTYDANGNLTAVTPPGKSPHDFSYNSINLPSSYTPPTVVGTGHTTYAYDADRRLSLITRPDGGTVKYNYDHAGRLSSVATPTVTLNYGYSPTTCNLISAGVPGGEQLTYGYDGPLLTTTSWTGTVAGNVSRVYNNNFWIASESIVGGTTVAFTYDNDGLLDKAGALTLTRTPTNGLITGTTLGAASDARIYNSFGELTGYTASDKGTAVYQVALTRDNLGRIATKSEIIGGKTTAYGYNYDASGRLTYVLQNGIIARSYTYDSNSNRLTATAGTVTTKGTYDAQDRLLSYGSASYTYTANGELASKSVGALKSTYQYDVLGNLLAVTLANGKKISYVIDPQNRRVGKKVNGTLAAGFLYDDDRLVAQLNASNAVVSQFIYASRDNVPDYIVAGGVTYRIFSDQLGSPRLVVDASTGQTAERIDYDEFGNVITDTNPGFQPFGFAGGLYDQDTKLVRFGTRDYDPSTGRWTAKDPILFAGGDTNLYGYVLNDPVNLSDPSGLDNVPDIFGESLPSKAQRAPPPKKGIQEYKEVEKEAEKTSQSALDYFRSLIDAFKKALCGDGNPPHPPFPPQPKPKDPPKLP